MPMQISISNAIKGGSVGAAVPPAPFENTNSFLFDGSTDFIATSATYSEMDGGTKLTLSVWIKPISGAPLLEYIVSNPRNTTANDHQFALTLYENNNVQFDVQGHNSQYVLGDINAITYGQWNHILVCVDLDRTTGTEGAIFINGVDETTTSAMGTLASFYTAINALHIGIDANGGYNPFNGNIDELALWSGQDLRDSTSVATIYNAGVPNDLNDNGLTAPTTWYRMGENATWDGRAWNPIPDVQGVYDALSSTMPEAALTTDVPLYNNKSFEFDGNLDYVDTNATLVGTTFSISAWFKVANTTDHQSIFSTRENVISSSRGVDVYIQSDVLTFRIYNNGGTAVTQAFTDLGWNHVLYVYDGTTLEGFLNGLSIGSVTASYSTSSESLKFGHFIPSVTYAEGNIDEVALFYSDESANVSTIYNGGVPNDISALSPNGWWRMGEDATFDGTDWTLPDNGSGGNDGTSNSMPFASRTSDVPT